MELNRELIARELVKVAKELVGTSVSYDVEVHKYSGGWGVYFYVEFDVDKLLLSIVNRAARSTKEECKKIVDDVIVELLGPTRVNVEILEPYLNFKKGSMEIEIFVDDGLEGVEMEDFKKALKEQSSVKSVKSVKSL